MNFWVHLNSFSFSVGRRYCMYKVFRFWEKTFRTIINDDDVQRRLAICVAVDQWLSSAGNKCEAYSDNYQSRLWFWTMTVEDKRGQIIDREPARSLLPISITSLMPQNAATTLTRVDARLQVFYAEVTTTIRLRFDGHSTAYQRSLRSQWLNPLVAVTLDLLLI